MKPSVKTTRQKNIHMISLIFVVVAFVSVAFALAAFAQEKSPHPTKSKENYKDIILKAQNLTLQQDRQQATQELIQAIRSGNYSKKAQQELTKSLNDISTIFYTEKTHKLFQYAKSLLRDSQQEAAEKYAEALKIEPNNILISLGSARLYLYQGKCEEAEKAALHGLEINPFYSALQLANLQSKACLQNTQGLNEALAEYKQLGAIFPLHYQMVLVQKFFNQKKYTEAMEHLEKAKLADKDFPEIYFWESQILENQNLEKEDSDKEDSEVEYSEQNDKSVKSSKYSDKKHSDKRQLEKNDSEKQNLFKDAVSRYIRSCKTLVTADYLKYEFEPRLCLQYKTLESEYKNLLDQENKKDI